MFLSIITPSYNRAHTLTRVYESLTQQTDKDFEWIVVDDGSADNTAELIQSFVAEQKIAVSYYHKENGGKPSAHNLGVEKSIGELCVCLDSDDAFSPDAVETIKTAWQERADDSVIGILAKRGNFTDHAPICSDWPKSLKTCKMMALQEEYGFSGDTALFFRTEMMQKHYFKVFAGEKFVPEDALYAELDEIGPMLLLDKVVYYCEYLEGGLTSDYRNLLHRNPMGTSYCYYCRMLRSGSFKMKLKNAIISQAYLSLSGDKAAYERKRGKVVLLVASFLAPIYRKMKIGG